MALGKKLRNRLVGLLVLVSVAMILVPAIMDPGQIYHKNPDTIAVDGNGAVTDQNGRMVQGGSDYSDLLAPVEGNGLTPEQVAAQNSGKLNVAPITEDDNTLAQNPLDNWDDVPSSSEPISATQAPSIQPSARNTQNNAVSTNGVAGNGVAEVEQLKRNQNNARVSSANSTRAQASDQNSGVEILKSSRASSQANTQVKSQNANSNKSTNAERLVSSRNTQKTNNRSTASGNGAGAYTVQVGVFSSKANADAIIAKLRASGVSARQVPAVINGRNLIRVYAGNASTREGAEGIARRVQQITGTNGSIVNTAN